MKSILGLFLMTISIISYGQDKELRDVYELYVKAKPLKTSSDLERLEGKCFECAYAAFHKTLSKNSLKRRYEVQFKDGEIEAKNLTQKGSPFDLASEIKTDKDGAYSEKESMWIYQIFDTILGNDKEVFTTRYSVNGDKLIISRTKSNGLNEHYALGDLKANNGEDLMDIYICQGDEGSVRALAGEVNNDSRREKMVLEEGRSNKTQGLSVKGH